MKIQDKLQAVLGRFGTDILRDPHALVAAMLEHADLGAADRHLLGTYCDRVFLSPFAAASKVPDAGYLRFAEQLAEHYLTGERRVDEEHAGHLAWSIASGIAAHQGIPWVPLSVFDLDRQDVRNEMTKALAGTWPTPDGDGAALYVDDDDRVWAKVQRGYEAQMMPPLFLGRFALRHDEGDSPHRLRDRIHVLMGGDCRTVVVTRPLAYDERTDLLQTLADAGITVLRWLCATNAVALAWAMSGLADFDSSCVVAHVDSHSVEVALFDFGGGVVEMQWGDMSRTSPHDLDDEHLRRLVRNAMSCDREPERAVVVSHLVEDVEVTRRVADAIEATDDDMVCVTAGVETILAGAFGELMILKGQIDGLCLLDVSWLETELLLGAARFCPVLRYTTIPMVASRRYELTLREEDGEWFCAGDGDQDMVLSRLLAVMGRFGLFVVTSLPDSSPHEACACEVPLDWILEGRTSVNLEVDIYIDAEEDMTIAVCDGDPQRCDLSRRYDLGDLLRKLEKASA